MAQVIALALGIVVTSTPAARAASATWNASPTDGVWDVSSQNNWSTGVSNFPGSTSGTTNADVATFRASNTTAISINSTTLNIRSITFGFSGTALDPFTIGSTSGNSLFLTSGGVLSFAANATPTNTTETINAPIVLNGSYQFTNANADASNVLRFGGGITAAVASTLSLKGVNKGANTITGNLADGAGVLTITQGDAGKWVLSGTNTYTGKTTVGAGGTLQFTKQVSLYNNNASGGWTNTNIVVNNGAILALNVGGTGEFTSANIDTIKVLGGGGNLGFRTGGILGLDTTNSSGGNFIYSSNIANPTASNIGIAKLGSNTLTLDGTNSYTGVTLVSAGTLVVSGGGLTGTTGITVSGGSLQIGASDVLNDAATMTLSGGTLDAQNFAETVGALTLSGNSTISLAGGTLAFADSSGADWGSFTINITGFVSGSSLRFGTNASGLSGGQFSHFTASGFSSFGLNSSGYLTAVPEPATWGLLAFSLTTVLIMRRRR